MTVSAQLSHQRKTPVCAEFEKYWHFDILYVYVDSSLPSPPSLALPRALGGNSGGCLFGRRTAN